MMTSDDKVGGWVKKGQNHDDVILECPLIQRKNDIFVSFQVVGIIIGALLIAAIDAIGNVDLKIKNISYVNSVLIAMLVLLVFMGIVSLAVCFMNKR